MQRLQKSTYAKPDLAKAIFEIIAAARRPLTLNELGEAISIKPGETSWEKTRIVNDVGKCLQSCGSLIVVDEEFSTAHFAHSSVKQYILSEQIDLDVQEYHVNPLQADISLGMRVVTYLNLDVLNTQLIKRNEQLQAQPYASNVPSLVIKSTLPGGDIVKRMAALTLLKKRKIPVKNLESSLETAGKIFPEKANSDYLHNVQSENLFYFLSYCQENWLYHSRNFDHLRDGHVNRLWGCLVQGKVKIVDLPWAPKSETDPDIQCDLWAMENSHVPLLRQRVGRALSSREFPPLKPLVETRSIVDRLEALLKALSALDASLDLNKHSVHSLELLLQPAVYHGNETVVKTIVEEVPCEADRLAAALDIAINSKHRSIAKLLINVGPADIESADIESDYYGLENALHRASRTFGMGSVVKLLLHRGQKVNACSGEYGPALIAAIVEGDLGTIRILLESGANVDVCSPAPLHLTPLTAAVAMDNHLKVMALVKAGADMNAYDESFKPTQKLMPSIEPYLIRLKNYTNIDPRGKRPLEIAIARRSVEIVRILLAHGAFVHLIMDGSFDSNLERTSKVDFIVKRLRTSREIAGILISHLEEVDELKAYKLTNSE